MQIEKIKKIEGCLEGTNVRDLLLSENITKEFVQYLSSLGKMIYQDTVVGKPFFRIIARINNASGHYIYTIKGSVANKSMRLLLPDNNQDEILTDLSDYISRY